MPPASHLTQSAVAVPAIAGCATRQMAEFHFPIASEMLLSLHIWRETKVPANWRTGCMVRVIYCDLAH